MAILVSNTFSSWQLSVEEEELGQILTHEQQAVLQNKLAEIARDKLNVTFNVTIPAAFAQEEAYLRGQMDVINWLLDTSTSVESARLAKIQQQSSQQ